MSHQKTPIDILNERLDIIIETANKLKIHPPNTEHYCPTDEIMLDSQITHVKSEIAAIRREYLTNLKSKHHGSNS